MTTSEPARTNQAGWRLPSWLRDVLLVALGALLAGVAEEWRDARATRHRTEVAIRSIRQEIATNAQLVERARAHHRAVADTLRSYAQRKATPSDSLLLSGIFNPAHAASTAWQTARDTRALAELPYPVALRLGALYAQQEQYERVAGSLEESMMTRLQSDGVRAAFLDRWANYIMLNQDFAGRAEALGTRYVATLAYMDSVAEGRVGRR